jgi:hypothetical protein
MKTVCFKPLRRVCLRLLPRGHAGFFRIARDQALLLFWGPETGDAAKIDPSPADLKIQIHSITLHLNTESIFFNR